MAAVGTMRMLKSSLRHTAAVVHHRCGIYKARLRNRLAILTYHRVLSDKMHNVGDVQPGMYVSSDTFERQMKFLTTECRVLSLVELLGLWQTGEWDPRQRYCAVTFDDGWVDSWDIAFPILQRYQVPATIFLATDWIGSTKWFWPERLSYVVRRVSWSGAHEASVRSAAAALGEPHRRFAGLLSGIRLWGIDATIEAMKDIQGDQLDKCVDWLTGLFQVEIPGERHMMNWDEVRNMSEAGIAFGSHSATHRILTTLSQADVDMELTRSMEKLLLERVNAVPVFCYPNGNFRADIASRVKAAGYRSALTTQYGLEGPCPRDLFALKRITMHQGITATLPLFIFHLSGWNRC